MKPRILVVDDDPGVRYTLREVLEDADMEVQEAENGRQALQLVTEYRHDLVITDLAMPEFDGMALLAEIGNLPQPPRVIMITAHGSERHAVEAMKRGAYDYFAKPFDIDVVVQVIERAVSRVRADLENEMLRAQLHLARHMVFNSDPMRQVALLVHRAAPRDVTVLITGPTGTGKELLAEAIVSASPRSAKPFVRFNCAAVPRELTEAELFGHARGAFTNAVKERRGLFREADGGTLLLDEVGELDLAIQGKLLRVLQEGKIRPLGEDREIAVDVRLIASSNRNLRDEVNAQRFREDLYYRLHVVEIVIPPLSERMDDIPPLVDQFLKKHGERFGTGTLKLSEGLRARLYTDRYPGNVRELEHRIERLAALSSGDHVDESLFAAHRSADANGTELNLKNRVEAFERGVIATELRRCDGNRSEAARRLGIGRVTLLDKMKKYGLK
jgi:two-component system response regulator HydG